MQFDIPDDVATLISRFEYQVLHEGRRRRQDDRAATLQKRLDGLSVVSAEGIERDLNIRWRLECGLCIGCAGKCSEKREKDFFHV